jgi:hypothetical protein
MKQEERLKFQFECPIPLYEELASEAKRREMPMTQLMRAALDAAIEAGNVQAEKTIYGQEMRPCIIPIARGGKYDLALNSCGSYRRKGVMVHSLRMYLGVKA